MAAITQIAANVREDTTKSTLSGIADVTIGAGKAIRNVDGAIALADATESSGQCDGIAVDGSAANQRVSFQAVDGALVNLGATLVVGDTLILGLQGAIHVLGMAGAEDFAATWYKTILGHASTTALIKLKLDATGHLKI